MEELDTSVAKKKSIFSTLWFKILVGIFCLGFIATVGFFLYKYFVGKKEGPEEIIEEAPETFADLDNEFDVSQKEKEIARVGREELYVSDLEYYARVRQSSLSELVKDSTMNDLINESVTLQAGEDEGWITLTDEVFNNPYKNHKKRVEFLGDVEEFFERRKRSGVTVETISIWFQNMVPGELAQAQGMDTAKALAMDKINNIHNKVKGEGMSMEAAAEIIKNDSSLAQLDPNYQGNSYSYRKFDYDLSQDEDVIYGSTNKGMYEFLQSANEGDISEIYTEQDFVGEEGETLDDCFYAFYKLVSKSDEYDTFQDWVNKYKANLTVEVY